MDLKKINEALNTYIRPQTFPLALRLVPSVFRYPILSDLRHPPTVPPFLQLPEGA